MSRHHSSRAQRRARAAWAPIVTAGHARCRRCEQPILAGQPWDVGHLDDLALGGSPTGATRPEHARRVDCPAGGNRSAGAVLGNQLRAAPRRRLAAWLELVDALGFFGPATARTTPRVFVSPPRNLTIGLGSGRAGTGSPQDLRWQL
jgi:hypothetical protein